MDVEQAKAVLQKHGYVRGVHGTAGMEEGKRQEIKAALAVLKAAEIAEAGKPKPDAVR